MNLNYIRECIDPTIAFFQSLAAPITSFIHLIKSKPIQSIKYFMDAFFFQALSDENRLKIDRSFMMRNHCINLPLSRVES